MTARLNADGFNAMFEACVTYESGPAEYEEFPKTDQPVWVLGKAYSALYDLADLKHDILSRIWITYRKNFSAIGGQGPSQDTGWGCMLRCGQMMLAQALLCRHLGRDWRWDVRDRNAIYFGILRLFQDRKSACYSIHQIAQMGVSEGKSVGSWFGPNTVAQVLRKLSVYDRWSSIVIHIAMDNAVIIDDVKMLCKGDAEEGRSAESTQSSSDENSLNSKNAMPNTPSDRDRLKSRSTEEHWWPLLLFIPLRLGLTDINPVYMKALQACFTLPQSLGIIGGKPNHAYYFIGFVENELVYLDPHTTQPVAHIDGLSTPKGHAKNKQNESGGGLHGTDAFDDSSYHCQFASRMNVRSLDPSIALGFYCHTESDFDRLCDCLHKLVIQPYKQPMFEICKERPAHFPPINQQTSQGAAGVSSSPARNYDTDEEFELL